MALAERHGAKLARGRNVVSVELVSRRNAKGKFSSRGHFFVFRVKKRKRRPIVKREYVVRFSYQARKKGTNKLIEIHLEGPNRNDRDKVIAIVIEWIKTGKIKRFWKVRSIDWQGGDAEGPDEIAQELDWLTPLILAAQRIEVEKDNQQL